MINEDEVKEILSIYKESWESRDASKISTIFSKNATYQEYAFEKPFDGIHDIKKYWEQRRFL